MPHFADRLNTAIKKNNQRLCGAGRVWICSGFIKKNAGHKDVFSAAAWNSTRIVMPFVTCSHCKAPNCFYNNMATGIRAYEETLVYAVKVY